MLAAAVSYQQESTTAWSVEATTKTHRGQALMHTLPLEAFPFAVWCNSGTATSSTSLEDVNRWRRSRLVIRCAPAGDTIAL